MAPTDLMFDRVGGEWDRWLASPNVFAGFCQTSHWARIHSAVNGATSHVISVQRNGVRVAGTLISHRLSKLDETNSVERLRSTLVGRASGTLECFEGPVLASVEFEDALAELLARVRTLARRLGVNQVRFAGAPVLASWTGSDEAAAVFRDFGYEETSWLTSVVDLTEEEEVLRRNLRQAARKGIRKSLEGNLAVLRCESRDQFIERFCKAYYETANAGEREAIAARNEAFWSADNEHHYNFFVVEDEAHCIHAVLGTYQYQGVATEIMSGRTNAGKASNLPAQDLLHWEVMLHHKHAGDRHFNLAGYNPNPANDKEVGIRRFKEKWGGREILVPSYTWSRDPMHVRAARWLRARARDMYA